jgi:hypothetical protein
MSDVNERQGAQLIHDYYFKGGIDLQGKIAETWQEEALKNAIRMWIASYQGDFIGQPYRGGQVMKHLLRPMSQVNIKRFNAAMRKDFNDEFSGVAEIEQLVITPYYSERKWKIDMAVSSYPLKLKTEIQDYIRGK